ncbi:MAG: ribonuclease III [Cyanobacteria bacterium SIG30]|nr:ribonuclease III [Cyanobacteria bacterium SIG30]
MLVSNENQNSLEKFAKNLGLEFKTSKNLNLAFVHPSFSKDNYERLEFLGDCVLRMVVSDYLFKKYKNDDEGKLTKLRAEIVSDKTLSLFARKMGFSPFVKLNKNEKNLCENDMVLACVFEAFLGAIYLEYNVQAFDKVSNFIFGNFQNEINEIEDEIDFLNPKAMLQEYSQGKFHILPVYNLLEEKGPEHNKKFFVQVELNGIKYKIGEGASKKEAQKQAAKNALIELGLLKEDL